MKLKRLVIIFILLTQVLDINCKRKKKQSTTEITTKSTEPQNFTEIQTAETLIASIELNETSKKPKKSKNKLQTQNFTDVELVNSTTAVARHVSGLRAKNTQSKHSTAIEALKRPKILIGTNIAEMEAEIETSSALVVTFVSDFVTKNKKRKTTTAKILNITELTTNDTKPTNNLIASIELNGTSKKPMNSKSKLQTQNFTEVEFVNSTTTVATYVSGLRTKNTQSKNSTNIEALKRPKILIGTNIAEMEGEIETSSALVVTFMRDFGTKNITRKTKTGKILNITEIATKDTKPTNTCGIESKPLPVIREVVRKRKTKTGNGTTQIIIDITTKAMKAFQIVDIGDIETEILTPSAAQADDLVTKTKKIKSQTKKFVSKRVQNILATTAADADVEILTTSAPQVDDLETKTKRIKPRTKKTVPKNILVTTPANLEEKVLQRHRTLSTPAPQVDDLVTASKNIKSHEERTKDKVSKKIHNTPATTTAPQINDLVTKYKPTNVKPGKVSNGMFRRTQNITEVSLEEPKSIINEKDGTESEVDDNQNHMTQSAETTTEPEVLKNIKKIVEWVERLDSNIKASIYGTIQSSVSPNSTTDLTTSTVFQNTSTEALTSASTPLTLTTPSSENSTNTVSLLNTTHEASNFGTIQPLATPFASDNSINITTTLNPPTNTSTFGAVLPLDITILKENLTTIAVLNLTLSTSTLGSSPFSAENSTPTIQPLIVGSNQSFLTENSTTTAQNSNATTVIENSRKLEPLIENSTQNVTSTSLTPIDTFVTEKSSLSKLRHQSRFQGQQFELTGVETTHPQVENYPQTSTESEIIPILKENLTTIAVINLTLWTSTLGITQFSTENSTLTIQSLILGSNHSFLTENSTTFPQNSNPTPVIENSTKSEPLIENSTLKNTSTTLTPIDSFATESSSLSKLRHQFSFQGQQFELTEVGTTYPQVENYPQTSTEPEIIKNFKKMLELLEKNVTMTQITPKKNCTTPISSAVESRAGVEVTTLKSDRKLRDQFNVLTDQLENILSIPKISNRAGVILNPLTPNDEFILNNTQEVGLSNKIYSTFYDSAHHKIKTIKIVHNQLLTTLHRDTFKGLDHLETVLIMNNRITKIEGYTFKQLPRVKSINLSNNRIHTLSKYSFYSLPKLKELFLNNNNFVTLTHNVFYSLPSLEILYIAATPLRTIKSFAFSTLSSLLKLTLHYNRIKLLTEKTFDSLKKLEVLDLSGNSISMVPKAFDSLSSLRSLDLSDNQIVKFAPNALHGLDKLEELYLSRNGLSSFNPEIIRPTVHLEKLDLSENAISSLDVEHLVNTANDLNWIDLTGNVFPCSMLTVILKYFKLHHIEFTKNCQDDSVIYDPCNGVYSLGPNTYGVYCKDIVPTNGLWNVRSMDFMRKYMK